MPGSRRSLMLSSLAVAGAVRQKMFADSTSASRVLETVSDLLQQRQMGTETLLNQLAESAQAGVTPGVEDAFSSSLKSAVTDIETQIETKIKEGHTATQSKLETLFNGLTSAATAVTDAKSKAVKDDGDWFECAAEEQKKRQAAEEAEKKLTTSRSNENEACQVQQDNKGFKVDATGKYQMDFECDHSVAGSCADALRNWQETVLQKMFSDAQAALQADEASYNKLKATCDANKAARVQAQSASDSAETAFQNQRATCVKLAAQRQTSICAFGVSAQEKCTAESQFATLVTATKKTQGGPDSEVDRIAEWQASVTAKCMLAKSVTKGLDGVVDATDLNSCDSEVNYAQDVGELDTKQGEFDGIAKANVCKAGPISFYNGNTWNVPTGDKPDSSSYTRSAFEPNLDPTSGNFDFC